MTYNEISLITDALIKGQFGINLVATTSCDSKLLKSGSHYLGRIQKLHLITDAKFGCTYKGMCDAKSDGEMKPQQQKGFEWLSSFFKRAIKSGKIYLQLNYRKCDKTELHTLYLLDGKVATKEQVDDFKQYFKASKTYVPKTQKAIGIKDEDATFVLMFDVERIEYLGKSREDANKVFKGLQG